MDLSGIIFVVLAVAWAVYLIPKALKHHDEMARTRSVDRFSTTVRVLARRQEPTAASAPSAPSAAPAPARASAPITRASARAAAARRRRVLGLLTFLLAVVAGAGYLGYVPWATVAVPVVLIVAFLVVARLSVRAQSVARVPADVPLEHFDPDADLDAEDTMGLSRQALADLAAADPQIDEGSLWDPLPVTLPTYVSKARARRTVRTIELTQTGVTSSGRSDADSALVRQSEALKAEQAAEAESAATNEQRKAAGA